MSGIEEDIRSFLKNQGVQIIGIAAPERLDGPPSLDPYLYDARDKIHCIFGHAHGCGCHL